MFAGSSTPVTSAATDRHGGLPSARASSSDSPTTNQTRAMAATVRAAFATLAQLTLALTRKAWACSVVAVNGGSPRVEMAMIGVKMSTNADKPMMPVARDSRAHGSTARAGAIEASEQGFFSHDRTPLERFGRRGAGGRGGTGKHPEGQQQDVQRQPQPADHAEAVAEPGHAAWPTTPGRTYPAPTSTSAVSSATARSTPVRVTARGSVRVRWATRLTASSQP